MSPLFLLDLFLTVVILLLSSRNSITSFLKIVEDSPWACNRILLLREIEGMNTLSSFRDFHSVKWFTNDEEEEKMVWGPHILH